MSRILRDGIIGISDGLTIPFVLASGMVGAGASKDTIILVGLAGIAIGALSMGLGGFFAFRSETEHLSELKNPAPVIESEQALMNRLGLDEEAQALMAAEKIKEQKTWTEFQTHFEISELPSNPKQSVQRAVLIAGAYVLGGIIPIAPFFFLSDLQLALIVSSILTGIALLCFGFYKARKSGRPLLSGGIFQLLMAAAGGVAAYYLGLLIINNGK